MLTVQSLRNALKKLQSSDLAKFLIQRTTGGSEALRDNSTSKPPIFYHSQTHNIPITPSQSTSLSKIDQTKTSSSTTTRTATTKTAVEQLKRISAEFVVSLNSDTEVEGRPTNSSNRSNSSSITKQSKVYNFDSNNLSVSSCDRNNQNMPETEVAEAAAAALSNLEISTDKNSMNKSTDTTASVSCQNGVSKEKACFRSSLADIVEFLELVGSLKHTKRTGWVLRDVPNCESISGHMYRMSMMTFLLDGSEGLNQIRCMELALVHDLAESVVGDLTPFCGVSKEDKKALELKAMGDICKLIEPRGRRIMELFEEYENGESAESKFVKDLDRLDMVLQAFEYEKRDDCVLKHQEFFDSTYGKFNHPFVKKLVNEIYDQRKALAETKGLQNVKQNGDHSDAAGTKEKTNSLLTDEKSQNVSSS